MARFEVVLVDKAHNVQWVSYAWKENITIAQLVASGVVLLPVSVFSELVDESYIVKINDRLECTQSLSMDPKALRRDRLNKAAKL